MTKLYRKTLMLAALCLMTSPMLAEEAQWTEDFLGAQATATAEDKDLLMDFTGSDWCHWCVRLDQEVFSQDAFADYANENFVLVKLDYPNRTPQEDAIREQNAQLRDTYAIQGYPTILLTDATGLPYAQTGYQEGGPQVYVQHLEELRAIRVQRDEHFAAAEQSEGLEKAQHLHAALQAMGDDVALAHYESAVEQIMQIDADNAAGLKGHYQELYTAIEQREQFSALLSAASDAAAALQATDTFLEQEGLVTPVRQEALVTKGRILFYLEDKDAARTAFEQAIALDPESEMADNLRGMIERAFPEPDADAPANAAAE